MKKKSLFRPLTSGRHRPNRLICSIIAVIFLFSFVSLFGFNYQGITVHSASDPVPPAVPDYSSFIDESKVTDVSSWGQFITALADTNIDVINITQNITRDVTTATGTLSRNLLIRGNGNTINFGTNGTGTAHVVLGNVQEATTLVLENVVFQKNQTTNNNVFNSSNATNINWNIWLYNVKSGKSANQNGLVNANRSSVTVFGDGNEWNVENTLTHFLYVGNFTLTAGSSLTAKTREVTNGASYATISIGYASSATDFFNGAVTLEEHSQLTISNKGTSTDNNSTTATSSGISGKIEKFAMEAYAQANITTYFSCYATIPRANNVNECSSTFDMAHGASLTLESDRASGLRFGHYATAAESSNRPTYTITIGDEAGPAEVVIKTHGSMYAPNNTNEYVQAGVTIKGNNNTFTLKKESKFSVDADYDTCFFMQGPGSVFNVEKDAELDLTSPLSTYSYCSVLRFYFSGNQTFNIDGGQVRIYREGGKINTTGDSSNNRAPGIRMYGRGNQINVTGGGSLYVYNGGNGHPQNGTAIGDNEGILYTDGNNSAPGEFNLTGDRSNVEVIAKSGPAIYASNALNVTSGKGTIFLLHGKTQNNTSGALNVAGGSLNFKMDELLYFDFRNDCEYAGSSLNPTGGPAINGGDVNSTFISDKSDLAVWQRTAYGKPRVDLDGTPTKSWTVFDYELQGANLQYIASTNIPSEFYNSSTGSGNNPSNMTGTYLGIEKYSRMNANNARAVVDELRVPTNADKYIFGHVSVPEGKSGNRDAWTDEVYVTVQVKDKLNNVVFTGEGITWGDDETNPDGISVYEESPRGGIFIIPYTPTGESEPEFLTEGYTVEVVTAYRSSSAAVNIVGEQRVHRSEPDDLCDPVTAIDKWPPVPVTAVEDIVEGQTTINGTNAEPGATVTLLIYADNNDTNPREITKDADGNSVYSNTEGKWAFKLPNSVNLQKDQILQILLTDTNGNKNPTGMGVIGESQGQIKIIDDVRYTKYHDAYFPPGVKTTVLMNPFLKLHIRQVVYNPADMDIRAVPDTGYSVITKLSGGTTPANIFNGVTYSGEGTQVYYSELGLQNIFQNDKLQVKNIIPQYFTYFGYKVSASEALNDSVNMETTENILIDASTNREIWLTVYITPISNPGRYDNDVRDNYFGDVKQP